MTLEHNNPMKAIIYTRVSTAEQVDGYSLTYQEELCREYCKKNGWEVVDIFREEGASAKTADREQLLKLLKYCIDNTGKIDVVVVHKLDRVARNAPDHHGIRAALTRSKIILRSVSEPIDETPQGKFMEGIYASVAQLDNDVRAERTKEGLKEKVKQGLWAWKAPLGYKNSPEGLVLDEICAPLIKKAFEVYALGGHRITDMAMLMNRWGLRTSKGARLKPQSVDTILNNKLYMGILHVDGWKDEYSGVHPKIIDPALFYKVQRVREGRSFTAVPRLVHNPDFPLKNIVQCSSCGHSLTGSWSKGRTKRYGYYHCACGKTRVSKSALEQIFYDSIKNIQPNKQFIRLFREVMLEVWKTKQSEAIKEVSRVDKEIQKLKAFKGLLIKKNLEGVITDEDYMKENERINAELAVREIERNEHRNDETDIDYLVSQAERLFENVSTLWFEAPYEHKLRFQTLLFPKGVIYKNGNIGTAQLGLPFALIGDAIPTKSNFVPLMHFISNSWIGLLG